MISSVSVYSSYQITSSLVVQGLMSETNNSFYLVRNIAHVLTGIGMLVIFSKIPYTLIEKFAKHIFLLTVVVLFAVLVVGTTYNGATGWLDIP